MDITLRRLEERDLEWARQLRNENRDAFFDAGEITPEAHRAWFENLTAEFYVICLEGDPVGTISINGSYVGNAVVQSAYRRRGIMKQAMELLMRAKATNVLRLEVKYDNFAAIEAYKAMGFETIGLTMEKRNQP